MKKYFLIIILFLIKTSIIYSTEINISVNPGKDHSKVINKELFGSFTEEHWGDITPGVYEQYLINPSFEEWYEITGESKTQVVFTEIEKQKGVAYPWQKKGDGAASLSKDCLNTSFSQMAEPKGKETIIYQKIVLPDYRTKNYNLKFYSKIKNEISLEIYFISAKGNILFTKDVTELNDKWKEYNIQIELGKKSEEKHNSRYGIYEIQFIVKGKGQLFLDQATLFPSDCVEGVFNPETITNFKKFNIRAVRWPGGNFTSGYNWKDGIGDILKRQTRKNRAWGGLNPNHVGTDEWMRFCKIVNAECIIGVGFGEVKPSDILDWIEYCNGSTDTPMGKLRAQNGHPEPHNIKYWGIGNEVYGNYQIGNTDPLTYAKGLNKIIEEIKTKYPDIKILACGYGVHNDFRDKKNIMWNENLLNRINEKIDFLDVHYYMHGQKEKVSDDETKEKIFSYYMASNLRLKEYCDKLRENIKDISKNKNIKLALLEWGVLPDGKGVMNKASFSNALCTAVQYHEMFRQSDLIKMAAIHNFSFFVNPVKSHSEPPNPRTFVSMLYSSLSNSLLLETKTDSPTYDITEKINDVGFQKNVPFIDAVSAIKDGKIYICIVNRSFQEDFNLNIDLNKSFKAVKSKITFLNSPDIFKENRWNIKNYKLNIDETQKDITDNNLKLDLPKHTIAFIEIN